MTDPDKPQRRSVAKVLVKVGYGLTALPVLVLTAFGFWALAKNNYRGEALGPSIEFLAVLLAVPLVWLIGSVGAGLLSSWGKPWLGWAFGWLVPILLVSIFIVVTIIASVINFSSPPPPGFEPPAVPTAGTRLPYSPAAMS